jgi:hypothetical protein
VKRPLTQQDANAAASRIHGQAKDRTTALPIAKASATRPDTETNRLVFLMMDTIPGHLSSQLRRPEAIVAIRPLPFIAKHRTTRNRQIPFETDEMQRLTG